MTEHPIRFEDGARYEEMMGKWSAPVGEQFLDWIAAPPGARWLDVGCGNGAFTQLLVTRCAPTSVQAFDPSPEQLAYARTRLPAGAPVTWAEGDAMALPVGDASVDVAVMALVLFFVPEPLRGVAEMVRAVRPGGIVAAYHWDILGGGFPLADIGAELRNIGSNPSMPPSVEASTLEASAALWQAAGLEQVETRTFTVQRRFESFDQYWESSKPSNTLAPLFVDLGDEVVAQVKAKVREKLCPKGGAFLVSARANAVRGARRT